MNDVALYTQMTDKNERLNGTLVEINLFVIYLCVYLASTVLGSLMCSV